MFFFPSSEVVFEASCICKDDRMLSSTDLLNITIKYQQMNFFTILIMSMYDEAWIVDRTSEEGSDNEAMIYLQFDIADESRFSHLCP